MQTVGRFWIVDDRPVGVIQLLDGLRVACREVRKRQIGHVIIRVIAVHIAVVGAGRQRAVIANRVRLDDKIHLLAPHRMQVDSPLLQRQAILIIWLAFDEDFRQIPRRVRRLQPEILPDDLAIHRELPAIPLCPAEHVTVRRAAGVHDNDGFRRIDFQQFFAARQFIRHIWQQRLRQIHRRSEISTFIR